jgi:hypothetical protein
MRASRQLGRARSLRTTSSSAGPRPAGYWSVCDCERVCPTGDIIAAVRGRQLRRPEVRRVASSAAASKQVHDPRPDRTCTSPQAGHWSGRHQGNPGGQSVRSPRPLTPRSERPSAGPASACCGRHGGVEAAGRIMPAPAGMRSCDSPLTGLSRLVQLGTALGAERGASACLEAAARQRLVRPLGADGAQR